jgi:hypothetical protein
MSDGFSKLSCRFLNCATRVPCTAVEPVPQASLINTEQKKEKARVKKLMNRKRRFLPFEDAREWARALCFKSQDDWEDMVIDGRKNSYIPADPSEAYAEDGWESWDDWLGVVHFLEVRAAYLLHPEHEPSKALSFDALQEALGKPGIELYTGSTNTGLCLCNSRNDLRAAILGRCS